jgi:hypothetical protein
MSKREQEKGFTVFQKLFSEQGCKSTSDLLEQQRDIESSSRQLKDTPKNRKLFERLSVLHRINKSILEKRLQEGVPLE